MAAKKEETPMLDPIAYRSDYNPNNIIEEYKGDPNIPGVGPQNANLNYKEYGDDSNPEWQSQRGGLNPKYEGEGVSNTYIDYDPNLRTSDLDPNYLYGENARQQNSQEAGYIARRNDQIASALYNEGLTSREDVENYLSQQGGWNDSTEADRLNTVESIWKRLGSLGQENQETEFDESRMEEGIQTGTEGEIFGKTTPNEGKPEEGITALVDKNSFFESMKQSRIAKVKEAFAMDSSNIAFMMSEGVNPLSEMTMRDLKEFYPEKYNEIQAEYKKIIGQTTVDNISMGGTIDVTSQLTSNEDNVTTSMNYFVNSNASGSGAGTLATNLNNALAESEIASTAREQREIYKRKIIEIQQAAESLEKDANSYFKGDVPDYIVKSFINNRMQKYNREIEKYQQLYNASLDEEKREVSQQQWNTEMAYKWGSLNADINYKNANLALSQQELAYKMKKDEMSNGQWNDDGTYSYIDMNGVMHTVPRAEAEKILNTDLYNKATSYIDYWKKLIDEAAASGTTLYGDQCEVMTDKYTNQFWGITMTKEDGTPLTLVEDKAKYVTDSIPERGFVAIWNYGIKQADGNNYGHTGIVIDYDPVTGIFTTLESNRKQSENGTPIVTIQEQSINSGNLLGFWDPTKGTPWNRKGTGDVAWSYYDYPNGMLDVFIAAESYAKDNLGVEGTKDVLRAERAYGVLNRMNIDGEIDAIMNSEEIAEAYNAVTSFIQSEWFLQNAYVRGMTDNDGNFLLDTVLQYLVNSGDYGITPSKKQALDDLVGLIQIKLRKESGAAINVSEWTTDYSRYLPQIGMSPHQKLKRIQNLETDVSSSMLPGEYKKKYIPIITDEMVANASTEVTTKDQAEEAFKNINK